MNTILILSLIILAFGITVYFLAKKLVENKKSLNKNEQDFKAFKEEFKDVVDAKSFVDKKELELNALNKQLEELRGNYSKGKELYEKLKGELNLYEQHLDLIDFGHYEPQFDFDTSEKFKEELKKCKVRQKEMIKNGEAAICKTEWVVKGSRTEGKKMEKKSIQLTLRAFNGECDALVSKVNWNNHETYTDRITRAFEGINKLNKSNDIEITPQFRYQKYKELDLTYEYQLKLHEEKEEQRRIREEMREEEKARKEIEKAQKDAEKEEERYEKALEKARKELDSADGEKMSKLNEEISKLQAALNEAHQNKERALSRAQMTRSGHVYIISNLGSFGEDIYKIGMTRRLEPIDRVKELGDASVPFQFDVHAMIYSEDAPGLESKLHKIFKDKRVNKVNQRKEYFRVSLKEIEESVHKEGAEVEFTKLAEAKEYRESKAIVLEKQKKELEVQVENKEEFPNELEF